MLPVCRRPRALRSRTWEAPPALRARGEAAATEQRSRLGRCRGNASPAASESSNWNAGQSETRSDLRAMRWSRGADQLPARATVSVEPLELASVLRVIGDAVLSRLCIIICSRASEIIESRPAKGKARIIFYFPFSIFYLPFVICHLFVIRPCH